MGRKRKIETFIMIALLKYTCYNTKIGGIAMLFRKAKISDVEDIYSLILSYAEKGLMLARPRAMLYEHIREFIIAQKDNKIIGVGGLHIAWEDLAEIRSLVIDERHQKGGIGRKIIEHLLNEAKEIGVSRVFTLTYQIDFFKKCGFELIKKEDLPNKVWRDCINCPKFPNCEENAMMIEFQ